MYRGTYKLCRTLNGNRHWDGKIANTLAISASLAPEIVPFGFLSSCFFFRETFPLTLLLPSRESFYSLVVPNLLLLILTYPNRC